MWSCQNMPKYDPGLRDILPDPKVLVQVICQNITVPNITSETYTKYNNLRFTASE